MDLDLLLVVSKVFRTTDTDLKHVYQVSRRAYTLLIIHYPSLVVVHTISGERCFALVPILGLGDEAGFPRD